MALKLKFDEAGHVVVSEGKPVYIDDTDGKELAFDAEQTRITAATLNLEAAKNRTTLKELQKSLEQFNGANPEEVAAFRATMEELGGMDGIKKLKEKSGIDVEAIKKSITESYEAKLTEHGQTIERLTARERQLLIGNGFATSKFLNEKTVLPPDVAEAYFGRNFKIEDGNVVAYLGENKIYSRERPGEPASLDEALQTIVDSYPMKDRILKAPGGGSGAQQSTGKSGSGDKTITRAEYVKLDPAKQSELALARYTITD